MSESREEPRRRGRFFRADPAGPDGVQHAVDDELRFHFDMTMRELVASGMSPEAARREAERRFGDLGLVRERLARIDLQRAGQERRAAWGSALLQDARYAVRGVRRAPGFAAVIVLALGLGIGANAAMFGIVDRLLFRSPAYLTAPDRVHKVWFQRDEDGQVVTRSAAQYQRLLDIAAASTTVEVLAAYSTRRMPVGIGEQTHELTVGGVSASLWQLFGARPVIGRFFGPDEDRDPGAARVVVLSHGFWQSEYGGDGKVIGRSVSIGPSQYTIIGVAPRGFSATQLVAPSAYIPITAAGADGFGRLWERYRTTYNITWLEILVRRKPGVSVEAATSDLSTAYRRSYEAQVAMQPRTPPLQVARPRVVLHPVIDERGPSRSAETEVATWLLGVAGVVLLIACANVGNLLLGRALRRRREIAVRLALGVSRARLTAQLLVESLMLALLGAAAGLLVAQWGGRILRATLLPLVDWESAVGDQRLLAFAGAVALVAGLLSGIAPILQSRRTDLALTLKAGAREGYTHRSRLRATLLVVQAGLSVVLLIGAGLFVRSLRHVTAVDPGYDVDRLVWVEPHLRGTSLDSIRLRALQEALLARARGTPGVEEATFALTIPFSSTYSDDIYLPGSDSASTLGAFIQQGASPGYFATTGTRIVQGRRLVADDRSGAPLVAVVSASMARGLWRNRDPLGQCVKVGADSAPCRTVVGVAEDVKLGAFTGDDDLVYYLPAAQLGASSFTLLARVTGDPESAVHALRRELQAEMPGAGYVVVRAMRDVVAPSMRSWRLGATMFAIFGGLALALAALGLFSVVAHAVAQRSHEVGVRIALGARGADIVWLMMRESLRIVMVGIALGTAVALIAGRWIQPLLVGVTVSDPAVLVCVVATLLAVAVAGTWIPASRAARVDPAVALRAD